MTYFIYCDESSDSGTKYCDFFGGCIISSRDLNEVTAALNAKKESLNLFREVKWTRITENYAQKYIELIDLFFDFVHSGKIKVRIMFRPTSDHPSSAERTSNEAKYFKLYYQFLKHAFGLMRVPPECSPADFFILLDTLPDKHGKREEFKVFLAEMPLSQDFIRSKITIRPRNIMEVDSRDHILLQCTDIVLGAMQFKLNGFDKYIPDGARRRGKRTVAKERVYKHIQKRISEIHPNFNIGVSTGARGYDNPHWESPYEHWLFHAK